MSVQATGWVIENSGHAGGALVVLLMIANHAKSDGTGAWPSIAALARESRMSERNVQYALRKLERSGELTIEHGAGPRGCHLYSLPYVAAANAAGRRPVQGEMIATPKPVAPRDSLRGVQNGASESPGGGAKRDVEGVQSQAPEPSLELEPSRSKSEPEPSLAPTARRDEVFEALAESCGIDWRHLTPTARGALNAATKALREAGDADPAEIEYRAGAYRQTYPTMALTPTALAKHWPALANGVRHTQPLSTADRILLRAREEGRDAESASAGDRRSPGGRLPPA